MQTILSQLGATVLGLALISGPAVAGGRVDCDLEFSVSSWSLIYKSGEGRGTIHCDNGQSMAVSIRTKGGGLTVGKSTIDNGRGDFSGVNDIAELIGTYVSAEAHAGAVRSAKGQVVTKGEVSLALAGTGRGWDLGVAFGKFEIRPL